MGAWGTCISHGPWFCLHFRSKTCCSHRSSHVYDFFAIYEQLKVNFNLYQMEQFQIPLKRKVHEAQIRSQDSIFLSKTDFNAVAASKK